MKKKFARRAVFSEYCLNEMASGVFFSRNHIDQLYTADC